MNITCISPGDFRAEHLLMPFQDLSNVDHAGNTPNDYTRLLGRSGASRASVHCAFRAFEAMSHAADEAGSCFALLAQTADDALWDRLRYR